MDAPQQETSLARVAPRNPQPISKKKPVAASKTTKVARRASRTLSKAQRLVCRYCGSDDLAPSFKKRRDARCRACFKKRYGSTARGTKAKRAGKGKANK